MAAADQSARYLELADRFDLLAAKERDKSLRLEYGRMATRLRQMASDRILGQRE